jgi:TonB family protein
MKTLYKITLLFALILLSSGFTFAQTEREQGTQLYQKGDYSGAVKLLKQATKTDADDAQAWYFLGVSYLRTDKRKESEKAFKKAVALDPTEAKAHVGLAYVYLLKNNSSEARNEAQSALKINPNDAEAHYIYGVVNFRNSSFNAAYERAKKAIELNPNFANAYLLKSETLVSSFVIQTGTVTKLPGARNQMLQEAADDLERYLTLMPTASDAEFKRENLESLKFFSEYYGRPENQKAVNFDITAQPDADKTPLKVLSKPPASYTENARSAGVSGAVRLLVGFSADGAVKHILIVKPLGFGLNEEAVRAARRIKFEPATKDGKPVSVVKQIEYSFSIY